MDSYCKFGERIGIGHKNADDTNYSRRTSRSSSWSVDRAKSCQGNPFGTSSSSSNCDGRWRDCQKIARRIQHRIISCLYKRRCDWLWTWRRIKKHHGNRYRNGRWRKCRWQYKSSINYQRIIRIDSFGNSHGRKATNLRRTRRYGRFGSNLFKW